jgi:predicted nucleic acid-binding protein
VAETLNYLVAKSRDATRPDRVARDLLGEDGPPWLDLVFVDEAVWRTARDRYRVLSRAGVSFTDCTSIALAHRHALSAIVSFDDDFDGLLPRVS